MWSAKLAPLTHRTISIKADCCRRRRNVVSSSINTNRAVLVCAISPSRVDTDHPLDELDTRVKQLEMANARVMVDDMHDGRSMLTKVLYRMKLCWDRDRARSAFNRSYDNYEMMRARSLVDAEDRRLFGDDEAVTEESVPGENT